MKNLPPTFFWKIIPWFLITGCVPIFWLGLRYTLDNNTIYPIDWILCVIFIVSLSIFFALLVSDLGLRSIKVVDKFANSLLNIGKRENLRDYSYRELHDLALQLEILLERLNFRYQILFQQQKELEVILSNMVEGVLVVSHELEIKQMNKRFAEIFNCSCENSVGKYLQEIIRNPNLTLFINNLLATKTELVDEITLVGIEDHNKHILITGNVIYDSLKTVVGALIVVNDITKVHKLEDVRKEFVANVSHELKTPITSIKGFVETLLEEDEEEYDHKKSRKFLKIILKHANRLNSIIEDLLSLARLEQDKAKDELELEAVEVELVINNAIENYKSAAEEKEIDLKISHIDRCLIYANSRLIEQAIGNLIDNAIKYSNPQSEVLISATLTNDNTVKISVKDYGCGIGAKHLPRLFERFYRVDKSRSRQLGGTGLGLAIVKHIALVHGGSVDVESEKEVGSVFSIYLPTKPANS